MMACAVAVIFLGLTGAVKGMLALDGGGLALVGTNCMLASLIGGALIGESINIEDRMEKFGIWLRRKTGSSGDTRFVDGFVTASLTVCIGAMAVIGSINDRLLSDPSVLFAKTVLDAVIVMIMTATLGKGCIFSALSVGIFQGAIFLAAGFLEPIMTPAALKSLSAVGDILIFCVGTNLFGLPTSCQHLSLPLSGCLPDDGCLYELPFWGGSFVSSNSFLTERCKVVTLSIMNDNTYHINM